MAATIRVTPSRFDDLTPRYAKELIAKALGIELQETTTTAMEYGKLYEPIAIAKYKEYTLSEVQSGLDIIYHPTHPYVAGIPDALVDLDGLLEVKVPQPLTHIEYITNPHNFIKKHYPQVQGYLWITQRKWCDLISYNPQFSYPFDLFKVRIEYDDEYLEQMESKINNFINSQVVPLATKFNISIQPYKQETKKWSEVPDSLTDEEYIKHLNFNELL